MQSPSGPKPAPKKSRKKAVKKKAPYTPQKVSTSSGLTKKELKFCQEYILDFNCARACRDTGISPESRRAYALLKDQKIMDEIERLENAVGKKLKVKAQEIAAGLLFIAKRCTTKKGWNPRAAVQAYSRLGAYTGGFREETNVNHKLTVQDGRKDFSKMTDEELDKFIENERAARSPA